MVFMPPGSAKSTYVDVVFVPWFMARRGRQNVILASYASDLARKQGRRARALVKGRSFGELFDARLSAESSAADEWSLTNGSEYMAGGILSGITGNRADLLVVDDPVKGREDANSETIRKKTREAYDDDLCTRLKPGGRQIIVQTRWHEDDLSGGILPKDWKGESGLIPGRDGRDWRVICLPAQADRPDDPLGRQVGEYLWPEWFTEAHWQPFKRNARTWSALFQQKPTPEEGTYFQRSWFEQYDKQPPSLRIYMTSDYATKEDAGDYTEHQVWGIDPRGDLWLLDGWYGQTAAGTWIEEGLNLVAKWKPLAWFGESGVIRNTTEGPLRRRMRERSTYCRLEYLPSVTDKPSRARAFQAFAEFGRVHLPNTDYGARAISQMATFPAGAHDDWVDAASLIGRAIDEAHPAIVPVEAKKNTGRDGYWPSDDDEEADSWKTI